jgi:hypothetical protein
MMSAKISRLCLRLVLYPSSASGQEWHTFAHAVEHKLHPDDKTCFICIAADHLSHNVTASQTSLPISLHRHLPIYPLSQLFWSETAAFFYALGSGLVGFILANHYDLPPAQMTVALLYVFLLMAWALRARIRRYTAR